MARKLNLLAQLVKLNPEYERKELYALILCGKVYIDGCLERDPKRMLGSDVHIEIRKDSFVSRGGLKLEHALNQWHWDINGKVFIDAGASTGGFTQCLLRHGASCVHAVDVGFNQLHHTLRIDSRVLNYEKTNIFEIGDLNPPAHSAVADLSFRSLSGAAEHILSLTAENRMIALLKPQFEWRNPDPSFDGIVPEDRLVSIVRGTGENLASENVYIRDIILSPIRGTKGNREFLCWLTTSREEGCVDLEKKLLSLL